MKFIDSLFRFWEALSWGTLHVLGLPASIVGVATASSQISKGLYDITKEFVITDKHVKTIAKGTGTISQVLSGLKKSLEVDQPRCETERLAADFVASCEDIVKETNELLLVLQLLAKLAESQYGHVMLRVRWPLERSRFAAHRRSLESLQRILTFLLAGTGYAAAIHRRYTGRTFISPN